MIDEKNKEKINVSIDNHVIEINMERLKRGAFYCINLTEYYGDPVVHNKYFKAKKSNNTLFIFCKHKLYSVDLVRFDEDYGEGFLEAVHVCEYIFEDKNG